MSYDSVRNPEEYAIQRFQDIQNGHAHTWQCLPNRTACPLQEPEPPLKRFEAERAAAVADDDIPF